MRLLAALSLALVLAVGAQAATREGALQSVAAARARPIAEFRKWVVEHGKAYLHDEAEFARRFDIWRDNLDYIHEYNTQGHTHWLGLNNHADLTHAEFREQRLGFDYAAYKRRRATQPRLQSEPWLYANVDGDSIPDAIDWRDEGAVSHVKNQERCGSCWAFSTTGALEGVNAIYSGTLEVLSEQELIDCDTKHDHGCSGGLMDTAFEWVLHNGGIDTERDYKYHAVEGVCSVNREHREVVTIDDYEDVPHENEEALKAAVAHQPVATAVQANERQFQLYSGGVLTEECGTALDHGVLIAGYGRENHTDFWLIKNSWGPEWGDEGYLKLERTGSTQSPGKCGLAMVPSFPIKKHANPPRPPKPAPDPPTPAPAPTPIPPQPKPVVCDSTTECYPNTTCCCMQTVLNMCLQWACCPIPHATCCDDHVHCCPEQLPVCDVEHGRCLPDQAGDGGLLAELESVALLEKVPAMRRWFRSGIRDEQE